ncbi:MAG: hypothetical protein IJI05_01500, partial [Erysipelotrichaceae bacterium]|nr:hypothetical protein [Erysipelotrichaceae bacterium]
LSNMSPEGLLDRISVSTKNNTRIITISILDPDPQMAQKIANSVRVNAAKQIQKVTNSEAVNVVDTANLPTGQYSPSLVKNIALAFLIGVALSSGFIAVAHIMNDTIRSDEDLEKYLGVTAIGIIPMDKNEAVSSRKKNSKNRRKKG